MERLLIKRSFKKLSVCTDDMDDEMYSTRKLNMNGAQKMQDLRRRNMWVKANSSDPGRPYETPKYIHPFPDVVQHLKETSPKVFEKLELKKPGKVTKTHEPERNKNMNSNSNTMNPRNRFRRSALKSKSRGLQITQDDHGRPFVPGGAPTTVPSHLKVIYLILKEATGKSTNYQRPVHALV